MAASFMLGCASQRVSTVENVTPVISPPQLLEQSFPYYPREARQMGWEGKTKLYLLVSETGQVVNVRINTTSGNSFLDSAAVQYAENLSFRPGLKDGEPAKQWMNWVVEFKLNKGIPYFHPIEYTFDVSGLYKNLVSREGLKKENMIEDILLLHKSFINYVKENPGLNHNEYIQKLIKEEIRGYWETFWDFSPMNFVVIQDFLTRIPDSMWKAEALGDFSRILKLDLAHTHSIAADEENLSMRNELIEKIKFLLETQYPEMIDTEIIKLLRI
jgi:TonB family protein